MRKVRLAAMVALIGSLLLSGATPAFAADEPRLTSLHVTPASGSGQHGTFPVTVLDLPDDVVELRASAGRVLLARLTSAPWTFKVTVPSPEVTITVTDRAGNVTQGTVRYVDDRSGPWTYADFKPSFGYYVPEGAGTMWVTYDDQSAVRRVEFHDGNVVINIPKNDFRFRYDFGRTSKPLTAEFWAWDEWGNKSVTRFFGWVDASAPVVTKMTPVGNTLVHGARVASAITAADAVGVKNALLVGAPVDTAAPYAASIPAGKDGRLMLCWYITDQLGHTAQFTRFVTVDNTKPGLRIVSAPANGAKVKGAVRVVAAASDRNGINRVELIINGKIVSAGTGTFSINTAKYGKTLKVQFRAWDRAGNWQVTSVRTWRR